MNRVPHVSSAAADETWESDELNQTNKDFLEEGI